MCFLYDPLVMLMLELSLVMYDHVIMLYFPCKRTTESPERCVYCSTVCGDAMLTRHVISLHFLNISLLPLELLCYKEHQSSTERPWQRLNKVEKWHNFSTTKDKKRRTLASQLNLGQSQLAARLQCDEIRTHKCLILSVCERETSLIGFNKGTELKPWRSN